VGGNTTDSWKNATECGRKGQERESCIRSKSKKKKIVIHPMREGTIRKRWHYQGKKKKTENHNPGGRRERKKVPIDRKHGHAGNKLASASERRQNMVGRGKHRRTNKESFSTKISD